MIRRIIQIDEEKCNGCGACAKACHEGAISMVNGKAKLMRDDYCDGLGDCLPNCPVKTTWAVISASIFSSIARRKLTSSTRSISSRDLFTTGSPR